MRSLTVLVVVLLLLAPAAVARPREGQIIHDLVELALARYDTDPTPFAACVVDDRTGEVVSRTLNTTWRDRDPTAHGEVNAIRAACKKLQTLSLKGYTLYTTCEPCAMCSTACILAHVDRVVYGASIDDASRYMPQIHLSGNEIARKADSSCTFVGPVDRDECLTLFTDPRARKLFDTWKK